VSRIDWSAAALGAQVVPILLVHGLPAIFLPDGVTISNLAIPSPDAAWWPGNDLPTWETYAKPWLLLGNDGIRISERASPGATQMLDVSEVTVLLSDVDLEATALFASEQIAVGTYLTATFAASDTTLHVASTSGFASAGVVYLNQEAISYSGKTGTTFTGCARGLFGSTPVRHLYSATQGDGFGNSAVTDRPVEHIGRTATLWLAHVVDGELAHVQLEHYGVLGVGPALSGDGETEAWVLHVDHAVKRLAQPIRAKAVSVGGYAHPGNLGGRATGIAPSDGDLTPFYLRMAADSVSAVSTVLLTGDAAAPDLGGWHPTRESFVAALNMAGASTGIGDFRATLSSGNRLQVAFNSTPTVARFYRAFAPCTREYSVASEVAANTFVYDFGEMAEAWVPITTGSPVYLSAADYAAIPPAPSSSLAAYVLVFGDDRDRSTRRVARITGQGTSGAASYVTCTALTTAATARATSTSGSGIDAPDGAALWRGGYYGAGFILTAPTTARIGLSVSSSSWVTALRTLVASLPMEYATIAGAIDFDRIEAVARAHPSPLDPRREYVVDLSTSLLSILQNEAALNGLAITMWRGRVAVARIAEFASTETAQGEISSEDLDAESPLPGYEKGSDGIINQFTLVDVDSGTTVNESDGTSTARYGAQGTITATMPRSILGVPTDGSRLYTQIFALATMVLGPLRFATPLVTCQVPLHKYDLQVGDLSRLTLWRVPNGSGGRGITDAVAQVFGRDVVLFSEEGDGHVVYTFRLNPGRLTGYAPTALAAAGGISGAVVTCDVTTIPDGFSGTGDDAGTFEVGDLVRLVEIDSAAPTASTQHAVTAVGTNTLTLSPAPSGTFATLAAAAVKVMVVYDDWSTIVTGARTRQMRYAYLAKSDLTLDATHGARVFAA